MAIAFSFQKVLQKWSSGSYWDSSSQGFAESGCEKSALPLFCPFSLTKTKLNRALIYLLSEKEKERKVAAWGL